MENVFVVRQKFKPPLWHLVQNSAAISFVWQESFSMMCAFNTTLLSYKVYNYLLEGWYVSHANVTQTNGAFTLSDTETETDTD